MNYGYVRVSTTEQNPDRQIKKMFEYGIDAKNVYMDKASGKNLDRKNYQLLISKIEAGDLLVLDSLDRLGRSYDDITSEWKRITREVGADIVALDLEFMDSRKFKDFADIGKVMEDMILSVLAWKAQKERTDLLRRQKEGIALAKERGVYKGRSKMQFDNDQIKQVEEFLAGGGSKSQAAKMLGVSRGTMYSMISDGRICA